MYKKKVRWKPKWPGPCFSINMLNICFVGINWNCWMFMSVLFQEHHFKGFKDNLLTFLWTREHQKFDVFSTFGNISFKISTTESWVRLVLFSWLNFHFSLGVNVPLQKGYYKLKARKQWASIWKYECASLVKTFHK